MLPRQRLELADECPMPPAGQVSINSVLEAVEAKLLQTTDFGLRKTVVGEVSEWRPPPERERLLQPPLGLQTQEAGEVELIRLDTQQVPGRLRLNALLAEELPQLRDVDLQRFLRRRGRLLLPKRVDQTVAGHDAVRLQQEECQQRALLLPTKIERQPVRSHL